MAKVDNSIKGGKAGSKPFGGMSTIKRGGKGSKGITTGAGSAGVGAANSGFRYTGGHKGKGGC